MHLEWISGLSDIYMYNIGVEQNQIGNLVVFFFFLSKGS